MTVIADIETELGKTAYTTRQTEVPDDPNSGYDIDLVDGDIADWADITTLLPTADLEDLNVNHVDGTKYSFYGFDSENTLVMLYDNMGQTPIRWVHCFKYNNATDYGTGKDTLIIPQGDRA